MTNKFGLPANFLLIYVDRTIDIYIYLISHYIAMHIVHQRITKSNKISLKKKVFSFPLPCIRLIWVTENNSLNIQKKNHEILFFISQIKKIG